MDNVTKVLLGLIAIGVWANMVRSPSRSTCTIENVASALAQSVDVLDNKIDYIQSTVSGIASTVDGIESDVSNIEHDVSNIDLGICINRRICG